MDTITLIRSAIRRLLAVAEAGLEAELRAVLRADDDYASLSKPQIDWDDPDARADLIDSRAKDGFACLAVLDGRQADGELAEAGELLATVLGQDLEAGGDGTFRIARQVAKDRVISTVDPECRHGHKTSARGFDGYKGHVAVDPDSEIITDTTVSAGNVGDAAMAEELIDDLLDDHRRDDDLGDGDGDGDGDGLDDEPGETPSGEAIPARRRGPGHGGGGKARRGGRNNAAAQATRRAEARAANRRARLERRRVKTAALDSRSARPTVYGDAAYGSGGFLDRLARAAIVSRCKTQPPVAPGGRFAKDRFEINLNNDTVTCPNNVTVAIRRGRHGEGTAQFADACADCPLRDQCTTASEGRTISVGVYEQRLVDARADRADPAWVEDYRSTRPKVERKLGHPMRSLHGGRRARVRGKEKVDADFNLLAAATNIARLAANHLRSTGDGWTATIA